MTSVTTEIEVPTPFPPDKVFKAFCDFENLAPKVNPDAFKSIQTLEGDGGAGTIRLITFGDGVPYKTSKQRIDLVDPSSRCYNFTLFEGDNLLGILDSITHHIKILPSDGGSVFKQTVVYNCKGGEKPSEEILKLDKEALAKTYKVSIEIEIPTWLPADKIFKAFLDFENIAPKVNPQVFKSIQTIQGNGGAGTIRLITFGEGVPYTSSKQRVDLVDESNNYYKFTFFEGDNLMGILDSITTHVKVLPSANGGSVFKQTIVYNCKGDDKPSEEKLKFDKEGLEKTYNAIETYVAAHPEFY